MGKKQKRNVDTRPSSQPKFPVVKSTAETFTDRINLITADTGLAKNENRKKYLKKMQKMQRKIMKRLATYPKFQPDPKPHDPTIAEIPESLEQAMEKLAMPKRKRVKEALIKINELLRFIQDDHQFYKNPYKVRRVCELMTYRKAVCCLFSKYPPSPKQSKVCMTFRPCGLKPAPFYGVPKSSKHPKRIIKICSRTLEFDFDQETLELALPKYHKIVECLEFYKSLFDRLTKQLEEFYGSEEQKEKLVKILSAAKRKRDFIEDVKAEIECRKKVGKVECSDEPEAPEEKPKMKGFFDDSFKVFTPFSRYLELPSKKKLLEILAFHRTLLTKVSYEVEVDKKAGKDRKNSEDFMLHVLNNIQFIENTLASYKKPPQQPTDENCEEETEVEQEEDNETQKDKQPIKVVRVSYEQKSRGRSIKFDFDLKTNELAFPKRRILEETELLNTKLIETFKADIRNQVALKLPEIASDESLGLSPGHIPNMKQGDRRKALNLSKAAKRDLEKLEQRKELLIGLIKQHKDRTEELQASRLEGQASDFHHHRICYAQQQVDDYKKYQMQCEHQPVTSALAVKRRLLASLEMYQDFLKNKKEDILYRDKIQELIDSTKVECEESAEIEEPEQIPETASNEVGQKPESPKINEMNIEGAVAGNEAPEENESDAENEPKTDKKRIKEHTIRLVQNMRLIEKTLKEYPDHEDSWDKCTHEKLHPTVEPEIIDRPLDIQRMEELAQPRKVRLRSNLEIFRKFMTKEKLQRIECQLGQDVMSPEQLEEVARTSPFIKVKNETDNAKRLIAQIERKLTGDILDEILSELVKKLPKKILKWKEPFMATSFWINLRNNIIDVIVRSKGFPKDQQEEMLMVNTAGFLTDFIIKLQANAMQPQKNAALKHFACPKQLKAIKKNELLIKLAGRLMNRIRDE